MIIIKGVILDSWEYYMKNIGYFDLTYYFTQSILCYLLPKGSVLRQKDIFFTLVLTPRRIGSRVAYTKKESTLLFRRGKWT